ncbi:undecaprenyldiphospho-muramoylpentapeptide beta-N-acetylglucosaminyltransferase [Porphyromonas pogonae]|uniref:undecaprenyldiphospho-muramoylpentapeptide beta-N-acetylglucosaminyltransferase n=1 Tax=Porphyromonas pogonae TaxID=867595 RepID=UPI002E761E0E|nr:undecaprenyldiphospho-muramoylpentapeptide beta-N-acetylglucosaminyltransferase [Porphyromonas pogonae]
MLKKVIISGGGTGGHIFPAISIADAIRKRNPQAEILFVGAEGRMEMERVPQAGYEIKGLPIMGLNRKNIFKNFKVIKHYLLSLTFARDIIREFKPDIVIGVGGYASAPTLKGAQSLGIPTLLQEQNSYAGVTNKMLARRADKICVAYPDMEKFFKEDKIVLTGNPIRPQIEFLNVNRKDALIFFGLSPNTGKVVLVVGGSLGARTINESIADHLAEWADSGVALIWQTGKSYMHTAQELLAGYKGQVWCNDFISRMDYAYSLADLVISRAGACSISELCLLGKASILVPSPNVAEDHQTKNALALSSRQATIMISDKEAPSKLSAEALKTVQDDALLAQLQTEVSKLAYREAAERIVDEAEKILEVKANPPQKNA